MLEKARREEAEQFGYGGNKMDTEDGPKETKPEEKKFFEGKGMSLAGGSNEKGTLGKWYEGDTDKDTLECIKMSLKDIFPKIPDASNDRITVRFRLPDGKSVTWRFLKTSPVRDLYQFIFVTLPATSTTFVISRSYPKQDLTVYDLSLEQAGLEDMEGLNVTLH